MAHIALFLHGLSAGGVQRSTMNLAGELIRRGHRIDIVCCTDKGAGRAMMPVEAALWPLRRQTRLGYAPLAWRAQPAARRLMMKPVILPLFPQKAMFYLPALAAYLAEQRPDALISADTYCNIGAIWARELAGVNTRIVVSERNTLSVQLQRPERRNAWRWRHVPQLIGATYPLADGIVSVSDGVGDDLSALCGVPRHAITTIYNPVHFGTGLEQRAAEPVEHPWLQPGEPPLLLAVGRLVKPKDFATLIRAFAILRHMRPARLLILGEEQERGERARLLSLARALGVGADIDLPGAVANPYAYYRRAAVFVLSSYREGLGNVLIEALACGCPVVSTDCPHGPVEILENGKYGRLVPVGDADAMAAAIAATLDAPLPRDFLRERGAAFSADRAAAAYLALCGLGNSELDESPTLGRAGIQHVA
ncbi:MAG TPA: glycosyltransferase [Dongiaceae bacterium]|nr:glycosyltransferase [Dongiaceae bacterium]